MATSTENTLQFVRKLISKANYLSKHFWEEILFRENEEKLYLKMSWKLDENEERNHVFSVYSNG